MSPKLIFLDIDGVFNSIDWFATRLMYRQASYPMMERDVWDFDPRRRPS